MIQAAAFAEEPAERQGAAALASEFLGESGVRDDLCARPAQRVDPADVVEVSVGEDEMRDLLVIRESQPGEGRADPRRGASGVDGDDSRAGADKREVGEVMALQHADGWLGLVDPGRGEPEAVPRGGPVAAELQSGVFGKTGEPGVADRRGCEIILAEHRVGPGEAVVRSADQGDRELVAYGQDESQVRNRPLRGHLQRVDITVTGDLASHDGVLSGRAASRLGGPASSAAGTGRSGGDGGGAAARRSRAQASAPASSAATGTARAGRMLAI